MIESSLIVSYIYRYTYTSMWMYGKKPLSLLRKKQDVKLIRMRKRPGQLLSFVLPSSSSPTPYIPPPAQVHTRTSSLSVTALFICLTNITKERAFPLRLCAAPVASSALSLETSSTPLLLLMKCRLGSSSRGTRKRPFASSSPCTPASSCRC